MYIAQIIIALALALQPKPSEIPSEQEVQAYLSEFGNDVVTIAQIESNFNPLAESHAGAKGVMQLMPIAILEVYQQGCDWELPAEFDVWNYKHNITVGACYFNILKTRYKLPLRFAVAAYNMGPTRVYGKWPRETRNYVARFFRLRKESCLDFAVSKVWRRTACLSTTIQGDSYD